MFLLFIIISLAISPGGLASAFGEAYQDLEEFYGEQAALGAVGVLAGLAYGTGFIFVIGAAIAIFTHAIMNRKNS